MRRILLVVALLVPIGIAYAHADDGSAGSAGSGSAAAGSAVAGSGSALPTLPNPIEHPAEALKVGHDDITHFGYLWGGMMVLYGIGYALIKANDEKHWLAQDHRLSIGVSVIGLLGAILDAKYGGGSLMTIAAAVAASISLILQKPTPGKSSTAAANP